MKNKQDSDKVKQLIGLNIVSHRKAQHMKQETLAKKIGVEPPAVSAIETGKTDISVSRLVQIAEALNIDFFTLVNTPNAINIHHSPNSGNPNSSNNNYGDPQLTKSLIAMMDRQTALMEKLSEKL